MTAKLERPRFTRAFITSIGKSFDERGFRALIPGWLLAFGAMGGGVTSDIDASLDELQALAPNIGAVSLVAGWFGSDLRAGSCTILPGVETAVKTSYPQTWSVNGVARADAHVISQLDGLPAYGGTPSDASIVAAIRNLKARGLRVMFCPFVFMDIAPGNTLTDPYTAAAPQPV